MDFKSQQDKFDDIKWYDSILAGYDRCGSYDFCNVCDKSEENPCARAAYRAQNPETETPVLQKTPVCACAPVQEELCCATGSGDVRPSLTPLAVIRLKKKKVE